MSVKARKSTFKITFKIYFLIAMFIIRTSSLEVAFESDSTCRI